MIDQFVHLAGLYLPKIAIALTIIAIAYVVLEPIFATDRLANRMQAVLAERERVRVRERAALGHAKPENQFLAVLNQMGRKAKLALWLLDAATQQKLMRAGYRDSSARATFLTLRVLGIVGAALGFAVFCVASENISWLAGTPLAAWVGLRMSTYALEKKAETRDAAMTACAPDIVDLLTICVESGMSIEAALQRVAEEMGVQNEIAADELSVTAAELSYVQKRSDAFANLAARTQSKPVQNLCTALIQADSFGTSIGATLRIQSAEARKLRQLEAERRALSIPPKLSVVMVFFFMPVIMIVMLYPSITKMMDSNVSF